MTNFKCPNNIYDTEFISHTRLWEMRSLKKKGKYFAPYLNYSSKLINGGNKLD